MKILLISPKIPYPPEDGHRKSIFGLIKYLSKRNHQIDLVAYRQNQNESDLDELKKHTNLFVLDVKTDNSPLGILQNIFSSVPYNLWKYNRSELKNFLKNYFQENKVDIVQVTNAHMAWVIEELRDLTDAPVILREENLEMEIMRRFAENQKNLFIKYYSVIQYKKFVKYEPIICGKFNLTVLMSKEDEQKLLASNPDVKTKVIPVGVEESLLELVTVAKQKFTLIHIGSLNWLPNLDGIRWFLNEIYPLVIEVIPEVKLYLYGGGDYANLELAAKIKSHVVLKGFVEDIWSEISDKELAIVPLRIGSGIRVKILELLAAGKNILTTSLGAEGISVEDNRHLLIADSPELFAQRIVDFFRGGFDSDQLILNGKQFIKDHFVWDKIAEEFEQSFKKLIDKK